MAVALPLLALANATAVVAVLRSRWFRDFFDLWRVPAAFLLFSAVLGLVCWLISTQVDGWYKKCAAVGAVLCGCVCITVALLWLAWVVYVALLALLALLAVYAVFGDDFVIVRIARSALRGNPRNGRSSRARN